METSSSGTSGWAAVANGSGGTTSTYTTVNLSSTTYFRLVTTCSNAGLSSTSEAIQVVPGSCEPVNDICANATPITINGGPITGSNTNTITDGPNPSCGGTGIKDVWYSFVYEGGDLIIRTYLGTLTDTRIALFSACGGTQLACNDDYSGIGYASRLNVNCDLLTSGETYYLQVGGYNGNTGNFQVEITAVGASGCTNPNATNYDGCATSDDGSCVFPELAASFIDVPFGTNCLNMQLTSTSAGNVVAWTWTIPGATPSSSNIANPVVLFSAPGVYPVTLLVEDSFGATDEVTQNVIVETGMIMTVDITADNLPQQTSWAVFDNSNNIVAEGTSNDDTFCITDDCHRFEIYDTGGNGLCCANGTGSYTIYLNGIEVASGSNFGYLDTRDINCPEGTSCNNPIVATLGSYTAPEPNTWYEFTPAEDGQYRISTCDIAFCDTKLWIYDYCNMANFDDTNEATVTYNDDQCGVQAEMTPFLQGGQTYYIRVGDTGGACGISEIEFIIEYMGPIVGCMDPLACNYMPIAGAPGVCYYNGDPNCENLGPDLEVSLTDMYNSLYVTNINGTDACLVNEGCLQGLGSRQILRFTTTIWNIGNQDYFIGVPNAGNPQFEYDECHNHYHYEGYAEYVLYDETGTPMPQIGFKNGFCVLDLFCPSGYVAKYSCGNMGITAGCRDTYSSGLSCQWIDITDVPAGSYYLVVRTNWDQSPDANGRYELRYDNNWAQVCISFDRDVNGNIINFTKDIGSCPEIVDCIGQPFGNSYPDCAGNCPGMVKRGDVYVDNFLTELDVHHYLDAAVMNAAVDVSTCTDLNNDGIISAADAVYLEECIHTQLDLGVNPLLVESCDFDDEFIDLGESVEIGISDVNLVDGYVDVYINNPGSQISAVQFTLSGVVIESVENLLSAEWTPHVRHTTDGYEIAAAGSVHSKMLVHFNNTPFFRVYYSSIEASEVCVSNITDVLNGLFHNVITNPGPCMSVSSIVADFTASETNICSGEQVGFTNTTSGGATDYVWSFPGGTPSSSTDVNPIVTYNTPGTYNVSLTASNSTTSDNVTYNNLIVVVSAIQWYLDADNDGFGDPNEMVSNCIQPSGYVNNNLDCNDDDNTVYPNAPELCNTFDDDCDALVDEDFDLDNDGYTTCMGDCDDNNSLAHPGAFELCNGVDEDCDGSIDEDFDLDNDGYTLCNGDCDDNDPNVNPGVAEICGNNDDENCSGGINEGCPLYTYFPDGDGDGFGLTSGFIQVYDVTPPPGYVAVGNDCNDTNDTTYPGATEVCANLNDDDCDGFVDEGCSQALVANDYREDATTVNSAVYPVCSNVFGNLSDATPSVEAEGEAPIGAGQDVWYHFVAQTNGVRIYTNSVSNDMYLELQEAGGTTLDSENENGVGSPEILIYGNLTPGNDYYVLVRNMNAASVGSYTFCLQELNESGPDNGTEMSGLCASFKCDWNGAQLYQIVFSDGVNEYSHTGTSTWKPLSQIPGLQYGMSYTVVINSIFTLSDAGGNQETFVVTSPPFTVNIAPAQDLDLRLADQCPTTRSLGSFISADASLCNFNSYEWEFTLVDEFDNLLTVDPVYWNSGTRTRYCRVNYIPGVFAGAHYRVRIRPIFPSGAGDWGTDYQLLCVAAPAGLVANAAERSEGGIEQLSFTTGIYPNPSSGRSVNLNVDGLETSQITIKIYDLTGKLVYDQLKNVEGNSVVEINFKNKLASGIYTVELTFEEERIVEKMIVE
ncbi:MAG: lysyl oxidase family protein [Flavobacteriales bacterium]